MPRRLMWVEWDDDAELSSSHKNPGAYSPLTRDADGNLGHATLSDADECGDGLSHGWTSESDDDGNPDQEGLTSEDISRLAETVANVLVAAQPHVARWWKAQALPTMKTTTESVRGKLARARRLGRSEAAAEAASSLGSSPEELHPSMTVEEARRRLLAALVARAFSDEQVRLLVRARIEDADGPVGFKSLLEQFTMQEIQGQVSLMLEAKPELVDEFFGFFGGDRTHNAASLSLGKRGRGRGKSRSVQ
jgi:hypothetical protein